MLINPKFADYQDFEKNLILRKDIADLPAYPTTLPDPPKPEEFINFGLPVKEQFFHRDPVPSWLNKLNKIAKQQKNGREEAAEIAHRNPEFRNYIADKWRKRRDGIWIYINGRPTYIPGNMWFYLNNYWIFQYGYPDFRFADVIWWYWWNFWVRDNPLAYGGIEMAMRRDGKTSRHSSNSIDELTQSYEYFSGFIGRSKEDAKKAFLRAYVIPIRKLHFYFTPLIDAREYPSTEMHFRDSQDVEQGLLSRLDCRPTVKTAYDGEPLKFFHGNEFGKVDEMLVSECWDITKECLQVQGKIRGKAAIESTIEEMNVGGMTEFIYLFKTSDMAKVNEKGETESGLLPYYRPAPEIYVVDQYGFSIVDEPTPEQAEWRKQQMLKEKGGDVLVKMNHHLKGGKELVDILIKSIKDPIKRQGVIRRYSRNIREAFRKDAKDCHFDLDKIENRLEDFRYGNDEVVAVNLHWRNNIPDGKVDFIETKNGKWLFKKNLWEYIKSIANNVEVYNGWRYPGNKKLGIIVADPYKYDADATETERRSLGTAHAFLTHIPEIDPGEDQMHWKTNDLIMEFSFRGSVDDFDERMMMTASFLGFKFSPETNSGDVLPQFVRRRYDKFLYFEDKVKNQNGVVYTEQAKNAGFVTLGDPTKVPLFNAVGKYIDFSCHKCCFPKFLEDCRDVEIKALTKFDRFVSGGNAIRIAERIAFKRVDKTVVYTCPNHPDVKLNTPGECHICSEILELEVEKGFTGLWEPQPVQLS